MKAAKEVGTEGGKGIRKIIRNLASRSGFWPLMWGSMWESYPKLAIVPDKRKWTLHVRQSL